MFGFVLLTACADSRDEVLVDTRSQPIQFAAVSREVGSEFVDSKGTTWRNEGPISEVTEEQEVALRFARKEVQGTADKDESEMTVEELAEALRLTKVIDGYQYSSQPDLARAARVLEKLEADKLRGPELPDFPKQGPPPGFDEHPEYLSAMAIVGLDNRQPISSNTSYPYRTQIWITNSAQTGGACSATLIGPSTATSAAHCFHSNANGSSGWYSQRRWAPGVDSQDANRFSYRPHTAYPSTTATIASSRLV